MRLPYATYRYRTRVTFSAPVRAHYFLLRCIPAHNAYQQVRESSCRVLSAPDASEGIPLCLGADALGNTVVSGGIAAAHDFFEIDTEGTIDFSGDYLLAEANPHPLYRYASAYTHIDDNLRHLLSDSGVSAAEHSRTADNSAARLCAAVHDSLLYTPYSTGIYTTAAEAFAQGKGVCQDYAHILIAVLRATGVPARYVTGCMPGEGQTHAWVEYHDGSAWKACDPTHNRLFRDCTGYIKLSHGRDYEDCSVERGVFIGMSEQRLEATVVVTVGDEA